MDTWLIYTIYGSIFFILIIAFFYIIAFKWVNFGISLFFKKQKLGSNTGFLLVRNSGNDFSTPIIIDLRQLKRELGHDTYVYQRDQLQGATLFGLPFVMFDNDDNKASLGLYVQESGYRSEDGNIINSEPLYYTDEEGELILDRHGQKIPILTKRKPSISLPASIFKSVVTQETFKNLKQYIASVMTAYKYVLIIVGVIGIGIGVCIYFLYNQQELFNTVITTCQATANICGVKV